MGAYIKSRFFRQSILIFMGIPLVIWATGNFPVRSLLKESLSIITILAFYQMIGQFFWARTSRSARMDLKMNQVVKYHKVIGYTFVGILFFHPIYLVVPRFFEAGISPFEAFVTIITTFNQGCVLGIITWCLMLVLGVTSFLRNKLPMTYKTWRVFHGTLAILFISVAAWHAMDLGRHATLAMSILISMLTASGILLLLKTYIFKTVRTDGK
ncbi:ferric reductase-like transmembrane domain-containing protein [uncultured Desulfobacter sp.]|uniref:ferric reductase-like transmembrane domain-containing protein n=1 Tax=uncultured Desulfobacter sp. TaxID=240139 RepID=UPI0029C6D683|nr:ferric reductase-like transmembrane domain-containing protein [uncultured Desulfobacter sp.]